MVFQDYDSMIDFRGRCQSGAGHDADSEFEEASFYAARTYVERRLDLMRSVKDFWERRLEPIIQENGTAMRKSRGGSQG